MAHPLSSQGAAMTVTRFLHGYLPNGSGARTSSLSRWYRPCELVNGVAPKLFRHGSGGRGDRSVANPKGGPMTLIHHVVTGDGPLPIVFVHGFACAHGDWDNQVAHLSPRHRTVAVDLRGHGASPGTAEECSIERYGADVAEVMRALALRPAVLVGHSMGC